MVFVKRKFKFIKGKGLENLEGELEDISRDICDPQIGRVVRRKSKLKLMLKDLKKVLKKTSNYMLKGLPNWLQLLFEILNKLGLLTIQKPSKDYCLVETKR